jgi:alcohol dehydrogenase class IV
MLSFDHRTLGQRVLFGAGRAVPNVEAALEALDAASVMVVASKREGDLLDRLVDRSAERLADRPAVVWSEVAQHVPSSLADRARVVAEQAGADTVVAIGGGSAIGLAKAIALTRDVRVVAVPTTFAGSEATNVWGLTEGGRKRTGADDRVLPAIVVYDAELTRTMPRALWASSGLNAVAHCVDSLWAPSADPINGALAIEGLEALIRGLGRLAEGGDDLAGHELAQYGCYLAAVAFASAGSGMHHKICHVLGGMFDLPHGPTHAVVLPYVLAYNGPDAPDASTRLSTAFGTPDPLAGLGGLRTLLAAPRSLRELGLPGEELGRAVGPVLAAIPASNPRPVDHAAIERLLSAAYTGDDPASIRSGSPG